MTTAETTPTCINGDGRPVYQQLMCKECWTAWKVRTEQFGEMDRETYTGASNWGVSTGGTHGDFKYRGPQPTLTELKGRDIDTLEDLIECEVDGCTNRVHFKKRLRLQLCDKHKKAYLKAKHNERMKKYLKRKRRGLVTPRPPRKKHPPKVKPTKKERPIVWCAGYGKRIGRCLSPVSDHPKAGLCNDCYHLKSL